MECRCRSEEVCLCANHVLGMSAPIFSNCTVQAMNHAPGGEKPAILQKEMREGSAIDCSGAEH